MEFCKYSLNKIVLWYTLEMTLLLPLLYYLYFFSTFTADQEFDVQNDYYTAIYCRMLPYLIGIMAGYYLWRMRGKELNIHWVSKSW
jgi:hypothetical protein